MSRAMDTPMEHSSESNTAAAEKENCDAALSSAAYGAERRPIRSSARPLGPGQPGYQSALGEPFAQYEEIRERVLAELRISKIQKNIKRAVLGEQDDGIELNFYKAVEADYELSDDMTALLSQSNASGIEGDLLLERGHMGSEDADGNTQSEEEDGSGETEQPLHKERRLTRPHSDRRSRISRLVDVEADCSEESGSNVDEEDCDLEDLVSAGSDDGSDDAASLFGDRQLRAEEQELRYLKRQFAEKRRAQKLAQTSAVAHAEPGLAPDMLDDFVEDSLPEVLEVDMSELGMAGQDAAVSGAPFQAAAKPKEEAVASAKARTDLKPAGKLFSNTETALERLLKKAEKKVTGFRELGNDN
ncbi:hypothetical protein PAPHI01_0490 [Pancytospora philotis]|nr:hypothetical protein PAPHI01_0490 [Pancytospora philotis]